MLMWSKLEDSIVGWMSSCLKSMFSRESHGKSALRDESATQFPGRSKDTVDLVIGLDFGTSSTKVVIRSPFMARSRAIAVPWRCGNSRQTYLLSTVLYENGRGEFDLNPSEDVQRILHDLKINLMDKPEQPDAKAQAVAYLGLTLRTARQWLLETQKDVYGAYRIRWALNMGIPSSGYDDEIMRAAFGSVARAAWKLSLQPDLPTLDTATKALHTADYESNSSVEIGVVPEIAAEVVGYARSRWRREGLHIMVDVGASTIDICGFVLHSREGDDRYELLTALVKRLGMHELHLRRMDAIKATNARVRAGVPTELSPHMAIPDDGCDYVNDPLEPLRKKLKKIDRDYVGEFTKALMKVIMALRKCRYPNSPNWKSGLPVFVAGGGGQFCLVSDAIGRVHERIKRSFTDAAGIDSKRLPTLETLENTDLSDGIAERLAVTYGLSFDRFGIGEITPPDENPDVPRFQRRIEFKPTTDATR